MVHYKSVAGYTDAASAVPPDYSAASFLRLLDTSIYPYGNCLDFSIHYFALNSQSSH